jgi:hypothetical protein
MPKLKARRKRIGALADQPEQIAAEIRSYIVAIAWFKRELEHCERLLSDGESFIPVHAYLRELSTSLDEGIGWIDDYMQEKKDFNELSESLKDDTAAALEDALDATPTLFPRLPARTSKQVESLTMDLEFLVDKVVAEIRSKGYQLYHVLIMADYPRDERELVLAAYQSKKEQ